MNKRPRYPQELRERAVRLVREHRAEYPSEWAAITSIAGKLGIGTEALRLWLRRVQTERQHGPAATAERERIRELEREIRELRRANEILKAAAAFFARELDPHWSKPCGSSPSTATAG